MQQTDDQADAAELGSGLVHQAEQRRDEEGTGKDQRTTGQYSMTKRGKLLIITAPSGAGKTTIVKHLLKTLSALRFSVSATNRARRPMEINGRDYYFLTTERFLHMVDQGAFLEWEEVYTEQYYGTLRSEVDRILAEGKTVIFDIDVKGALNLKMTYGDQALAVFIQPPSLDELINPLNK